MRLPLIRKRALLLPALAALVVVLVGVGLTFWLSTPVTRANFQKIQIGMAQSELPALLGAPDSQVVELGFVDGPETYSVNFVQSKEEQRARGFQDYQRQQWTSNELSIIVISDAAGNVVCRYSGAGNDTSWLAHVRSLVTRWLALRT